MILKYLLVIGVIAVVYFFFIKKKPAIRKSNAESKRTSKKEELKSSDMVECSKCGVYCEIDDAILSNSKYYCSDECLKES